MGNFARTVKVSQESQGLDVSLQEYQSSSANVSNAHEEEPMGFMCCGIRVRRSEVRWRCNFEQNCAELKGEYKWAMPVFEAYRCRKENRAQYLKEIDEIKYAFDKEMRESVAHFPSVEDQAKTKQLKQLLKESVIIPAQLNNGPAKSPARTSDRSKDSPIRQSIILSRTEKRTSLRKTKVALMSIVDENLTSLFEHKEPGMNAETANILRLFLHFTGIVETHSNTEGCVLYTIKMAFCRYFVEEYGMGKEADEQIAKSMTQDLKQFIKLYKETICDYYKLALIEQMVPSQRIFRDDNITNAVTAIVFKVEGIYNTVLHVYNDANELRRTELVKALRSRKNIRPEDLEIKDQYCLNKKTVDWYVEHLSMESGLQNVSISAVLEFEPYEDCVVKLRQLETTRTPTGKMKVIMGAAERITRCIQDFYRLNGIVCKPSLLDADQVLTIFSYVVIRSQLHDLHSHLDIVENFSSEDQLMSATGYYYSVILSSVENLLLEPNTQSEMTFG